MPLIDMFPLVALVVVRLVFIAIAPPYKLKAPADVVAVLKVTFELFVNSTGVPLLSMPL